MSANSYLDRLAKKGVIRELKKVNIERSILKLQEKLDAYFDRRDIKNHFPFGSFTRGTILPRSMDPHSDVDYMIIFADSDLRPQTCLDRLKRFAERNYRTKQIAQSHPTVELSLNHIRFELVPAIETSFSGIQIPTKKSLFSQWATTSPNEFNKELTGKNIRHGDLIKPLARLLKYWNACNDYPFESFELEKMIVDYRNLSTIFSYPNLWKRFSDFINAFSIWSLDTTHQKRAIERAQRIVAQVKTLEAKGDNNDAERTLKLLMPDI